MTEETEHALTLEAVEILTEFLLHQSDVLCGSIEGRRLQHILRELRKRHPKPVPLTVETKHDVLVTRTVDLSIGDDCTLAHLASQRGVSRDYLIRAAVTAMLDDYRAQPITS